MTEFWREDRHFQGIKSRGHRGSVVHGTGRLLTDQQLAGIYLHTRFGRLVVDRPANDATRRGWKIEVDDADSGIDPFADELDRLEVKAKFRRALITSGIYGGAGIVMILDDDGQLHEPVQGKVREVKALHVFSRSELEPATWYEEIEHPDFGEPETYWLHPRSRHTSHTSPRVHADRLIPFPGLDVPEDTIGDYDDWGQSRIEAAFQELVDINTATDSVREAIDQFQYSVLKLKNLRQVLTGADADADNKEFRARLDAIEEGKETTRMVVIDAEDEHEIATSSFGGLVEAYRIKQQNLSAATRIPITLLFGQSPSGLSTDDQSGTRNYYDGIGADQERYLEPALLRLCSLLSQANERLPQDGYRVKFHALQAPSEKEEADTRKSVAEADAINIDRGVYTADEARRRYTAAGFSADIVVDSDEPDEEVDYSAMMERVRELRESEDLPEKEETTAPETTQKPAENQAAGNTEREFKGAQIASMAEVVGQVARGELPRDGAIEILMLGFSISRDHAERFFENRQAGSQRQ